MQRLCSCLLVLCVFAICCAACDRGPSPEELAATYAVETRAAAQAQTATAFAQITDTPRKPNPSRKVLGQLNPASTAAVPPRASRALMHPPFRAAILAGREPGRKGGNAARRPAGPARRLPSGGRGR